MAPTREVSSAGRLAADHRKQHLERRRRAHGMRDVGRHEDDLAHPYPMTGAGDRDLGLAVQNLNQRVEGGAVLAQLLAGVKGEKGQRAGAAGYERSANHSPFAVGDEADEWMDGRRGEFWI